MDPGNPGRGPLIRTLCAALLVAALMQTTRTTEALSWLTRPAVAAAVGLFGGHMVTDGADLVIGRLRVPWSRDCAGFDVLLVLWGLVLWSSRHERLSRRFWLRMLLAVPASVLANIARVLTIIGWRHIFYPAVESPQMHYFIGFVWLLPLLAFFVPRGGRSVAAHAAETSLLAAALSLAAPQALAPGGWLVTLCTLLVLAGHEWRRLSGRGGLLLVIGWLAAAVCIAGSAMESLWLPWLLACPWCLPRRWLVSPMPLLLAGTIPLVSMKAPWLVIPGIAISVWLLAKHRAHRENAVARLSPAAALVILPMLLVPFTASTLGPAFASRRQPPPGLMAQELPGEGFIIRSPGQSPHLTLTWNPPNGSGRHHTLEVCMLYRGHKIQPIAGTDSVKTDGGLWLAEAFLMPDGSLSNYDGYLRRTLVPFSSAGTHLIASAPCESMAPEKFRAMADEQFRNISELERAAAD